MVQLCTLVQIYISASNSVTGKCANSGALANSNINQTVNIKSTTRDHVESKEYVIKQPISSFQTLSDCSKQPDLVTEIESEQ